MRPFSIRLRILQGSYITGERLGLLNADIWLQHHMRQIVGDAPCALSLEAPVEG